MIKTSITIAYDAAGAASVLAIGDVADCLAAYNEARNDPRHAFVGMLRKPVWYKRATPALAAKVVNESIEAELAEAAPDEPLEDKPKAQRGRKKLDAVASILGE